VIDLVHFDFDGRLVESNSVKEACMRRVMAGLLGGLEVLHTGINGLPRSDYGSMWISHFVRRAEAGNRGSGAIHVSGKLIEALRRATEPSRRETWSAKAASYRKDPELYCGVDQALRAILMGEH